jgi:hypothetical protein
VIEDIRGAIVRSLIRHAYWQYQVCAGRFVLTENIKNIGNFKARKSVYKGESKIVASKTPPL